MDSLITSLNHQNLIKLLKETLKLDEGIEIYEKLLNVPIDFDLEEKDFKLINCLFLAKDRKSLCLMNTRLWLRIIYAMGYMRQTNTFDPEYYEFKWDQTFVDYQRNIIDNCLYTSRVHDLLDISANNDSGCLIARTLLQRLIARTTDPEEIQFLSGQLPQIAHTNLSLQPYLERWIGGVQGPSIKFWDVRRVRSMRNLFNSQVPPQRNILDLTYWDVSNVTNMSLMFFSHDMNGGQITFRGLQNWNTCRVTNMVSMLSNRSFNSDISNWDVSKVQDMSGMFSGASSFNQDISRWDTSRVENMSRMFFNTTVFDQDIGGWDTSRVIYMNNMFSNATNFNQNLNRWNTSRVTNMTTVFFNAERFNQPLDRWNTSRVTSMNSMFSGAVSFNQYIGEWDTSRVRDMTRMFYNAASFNQSLLWDTRNVQTMNFMFNGARSFNQDVYFDLENNRFRENMFDGSNGRLIIYR
jgi:surface protein